MIRRFITHWLAPRLMAVSVRRKPDFIVGNANPAGAYLMRWWLIPRNPVFNIYLHFFLRSDDDRALHDHPWVNLSILLAGSYVEHTIQAGGIHARQARFAGEVKLRAPGAAHRIEVAGPCWTLFITGPRLRSWGFHCPDKGWVDWKTFTAEGLPGEIGPGCE